MIKTWAFFTLGGIFTAVYSNAVRKYPLMRKPQLHLVCTGVGFFLGYLAHNYEEGSEKRTQKLLSRYRHAPREWVEVSSDD
ncbi:uncharacterized protein LOC135350580 [Halichondria panicea]|uniref:uncharacterized protein LOC135350580 n=1 Tax=Halichondria panicea TaxID=6063 RepID=UPI00312B5C10